MIRILLLSLVATCALGQMDDEIIIPPKVKEPEAPLTRYISDSSLVNVTCRAEGVPAPVYKWLVTNEQGVRRYVTAGDIYNYDSLTGTLTIKRFTIREDGDYQCEASNKYLAASISPVITMLKIRTEGSSNSDDISTVSGVQYMYQQLTCNFQGEVVGDSIAYNWYIGSTVSQVGMDDGRLYVDTRGNLHFTYLEITDAAAIGYRCGVGSSAAGVIRLGPSKLLTVRPVTRPTVRAPSLSYNNTGVKVLLYSTGTLECFFSGYSPQEPKVPTVQWAASWMEEGEVIPQRSKKYEVVDKGQRLIIYNVTETDEGLYYCTGTNGQGSSPKMSLQMDVISPPIWQKDGRPVDQVIPQGQDAIFRCDTRSMANEPMPDSPVWTVNVKNEIRAGDPIYQLSQDKKTLTVKNVSKKRDNICFQCKVSNNFGTVQADACLRVILPIMVVDQPTDLRQVINYGDIVDMTIKVTTDPAITNLQNFWRFDNQTFFEPPPYMTYYPQTLDAYFNTSKLTREEYLSIGGVYQRVFQHEFETKIIVMELVLDDKPEAVAAASSFDWWIIGLILSIICLIIVIALIIFLCYRKAQEGDYNVDKKENTAGLDPEKELKDNQFDNYSPPAYEDYDFPEKKPNQSFQGDLEFDDVPIGGDDESLGEYGEEEARYFTEDGSFIGQYETRQPNRRPHATESTI